VAASGGRVFRRLGAGDDAAWKDAVELLAQVVDLEIMHRQLGARVSIALREIDVRCVGTPA
jgi:hypothetical protein